MALARAGGACLSPFIYLGLSTLLGSGTIKIEVISHSPVHYHPPICCVRAGPPNEWAKSCTSSQRVAHTV